MCSEMGTACVARRSSSSRGARPRPWPRLLLPLLLRCRPHSGTVITKLRAANMLALCGQPRAGCRLWLLLPRLLLLLALLLAPRHTRPGIAALARPRRAPRGWNSFDNSGTANESQVYAVIAALKRGALGRTNETGYEYVEMDGFWFSSRSAANSESLDAYGRPCPGADKYPSLNCSMKPLVDAAHAAGLKLGIWQLFGVPKGAVTRRLPILGTDFTAADIALEQAANCGWAAWEGFAVNHSHPAAEAWYDSLAALWSEWGLGKPRACDASDGQPRASAHVVYFVAPAWLPLVGSLTLDFSEAVCLSLQTGVSNH
jgi:hypothetical protein